MLRSIFWKPYSHLFIVGDNSGWSTDIDAQDMKKFADKLGVPAKIVRRMRFNLPQTVHYTSQFSLLLDDIYKSKNHLSVDYYHGKPEEDERFKKCFEALKAHHKQFSAVRVSNSEMENLLKTTGIAPEKIVRIPIGIDIDVFKPSTTADRESARKRLGIPQEAVVIGSFQKDGVGWGDGNDPKLIKGPDIFLKVIESLKKEIPNLWVLLSGPARGYVKNGLKQIGVPYKHEYLRDYRDITKLYDALDLYLVSSRVEGGPKAILESMAKGIPLVTTTVGQAKDLVKNGKNAMITGIEEVEKLSQIVLEIFKDETLRRTLIQNGLKTAEENSHKNQLPLWRDYFKKLIT